MNQKAQIDFLIPAVFVIILAGFLIFFGISLLNGFVTVSDNLVGSVSQEVPAWINGSGYNFSKASVPGFNGVAVSSIVNTSNGLAITSGNYTIASNGLLYNATSTVWTNVNVSYTYLYGEGAYNGAVKSVNGVAGFADYINLIVLGCVIFVVIGVIFLVMNRSRIK